jgi:hypothetical protein
MAAPDQGVTRFGSVGGDATNNFLKVYSGEVLVAYNAETKTEGRFSVRNITSGKSAQFPVTGKVAASAHTPGTYIVGSAATGGEKVITIDDLMVAPAHIANIDEAMAHYEVRSEYSSQAGQALAQYADRCLLQSAVLAARAAALHTDHVGGTELTSSGTLYKTSATDLASGIFAAMQTLEEKSVPESLRRSAFVRPAQYFLLAQSINLINKDWGGMGNYSDGSIVRIGGAELVKTNNLPVTNITSGTTKYRGDFTKTAAVVCTEKAAGTVTLMDLAVEMEYQVATQGTLIVARFAKGHDFLRPDHSVELKTTS